MARMGQMELKDSLDPEELKALEELKVRLANVEHKVLQGKTARLAREAEEDALDPVEKLVHKDRRDRRAQQGRRVRKDSAHRR